MKKIITTIFCMISVVAFAQDDLLNMLENETEQKPTPVYATFKSTRVINLQSNETMKKKHLDFRIMHRFQPLDFSEANNYGTYSFLGLDGAVIRIGMEYGVTDKLMVGFGRSTIGKSYDLFGKYKLLEQTTKGKKSIPVSVDYFANMAISTLKWSDPTRDNLFSSRLSYVHQLIITKKMNDRFSFLVSPTYVHYNLVDSAKNPNDIFAVGLGTSIKISRSARLTLEYIPRVTDRDAFNKQYHDAVGIGLDIETGGHVFQLHFTNSSGLIEQQFVARTTDQFNSINKLRFGFNVSRTFSFEKEGY